MADNTRQPYATLLPKKVLSKVESLTVTEAGWAAGPSFIVRNPEYFTPHASFSQALAWLERYRYLLRACRVRLSNVFELPGFATRCYTVGCAYSRYWIRCLADCCDVFRWCFRRPRDRWVSRARMGYSVEYSHRSGRNTGLP